MNVLLRAVQTALLTLLASACTMPAALDAFPAADTTPAAPATTIAPTATTLPPFVADLPVLGIAPELHDGAWLNNASPLSMAGLRGKVVALEMWTFG